MGEVNVTENDILLKKVRLLNACKTKDQWSQLDPVLLPGEVAFTIAKKDENDILNSAVLGYKVGNGTSKWSELDYPSGDWNINAKSAETAKEAEIAKTAANATVADTALKWKYDTKVYVSLGTRSTDTRINARSSEDDDKAFSIGVDGVLGIENGGTGQSSFTKNTVLIINNDGKMQGTNLLDVSKGGTGKQSFTENYLIVGNGNNALKEIEILGVGHGGTGKKTFKSGYVLVGNESSGIEEIATYSEDVPKGELTGEQAKYIVTLGALKNYSGTSSITTVGTITNGTWQGNSIGANYGGTGLTKDDIGKANAVVITGGGDTNKLKIVESKAGAFYSTGDNTLPQFGTLKVAYGGTGSTTFTQNVPIFYNGTALESRNYFKSTIWSDGAEKASGKNVYYITDGYGVAYFKRIGLGITPDSNYVLKTSGAIYISGNTTHSGDITFSALGSIGESNKITWSGGTDAADIYYKLEANDQGALIFNMRDDSNTHFRWAYNKNDLISMDMNRNFYPNVDLNGSLGTSLNRWGSIYAGILRLQGPSSNPSATTGARIEFTYDDNTSRLQPVYISYTPNDSYRQPAGLKIFGGTNATPAWLEVEGDIYANKSIRNLEVGGGIYWNPYVESAADASDAASITVLKSGAAGGTELRISQLNDAADIINLVVNKSIYMNSKLAFNISDSWLRINETGGFSSGTYFGGTIVRTDYQFQVGDGGNKFYANNSGNGYFSNTLGIGGTNTGYRLYVNGTAYHSNTVNFAENTTAINFRPGHNGYYTTISYQTTGNEALVFAAKNTVTSFMFVTGEDSVANHSSNRWTTISPTLQIKNKSVYINSLIANDVNPSYNLYVNGSGCINGRLDTCNRSNSASYMESALQIRERGFGGSQDDTWATAPRLSWHWSGRVQAQIGLGSNGWLYMSRDGSFGDAYRLVTERTDFTWNISAHMLDGYHESSFLRYSGWWNSDSGQNVNDASGMIFAYSSHGLPGSWGVVTTFDYSKNSDYRHQIYGDGWNNEMYFRTRSSDRGGWNAWRHLLDDSNYAGILDGRYINASGDTMTDNLNFTNNKGIHGLMAGGSDYWEIIGSGAEDGGRLKIKVGDNATTDWLDFEFKDWSDTAYNPLQMTGNKIITNCRLYANEWIQFDNYTGLYSPNNNAHFYPNNTTSYGQWKILGSKGGYSGIQFGDTKAYMTVMDTSEHKGLFQEDQGRWLFYYQRSTGNVGIRTSSVASYNFNVAGTSYFSDLITATSGSHHKGIKIGNTYINAIDGSLIFQNNTALRFGSDSWDWNVWAGLKYVSADKTIYLGLADSNNFTANSVQTDGTLILTKITNVQDTDKKLKINWGLPKTAYNSGFDMGAREGLNISQGYSETSGIHFNGDYIAMWSPCDSYALRYFDEDNGMELFNITSQGSANFPYITVGNSNTANTGYKLYVNGTSYFNGNVTYNGHILTNTDFTYDIGQATKEFKNLYVRAIATRHIDADAVYTGDHYLYIGYGSADYTTAIKMYYSSSVSSRTEYFRINSNGAYALTRFGVNGQNTSYNLYVNGTSLFTNKTYMQGTLLFQSISTGDWTEGIRIKNATNGWTSLLLGGNSDSGHSWQTWSMHTYDGNFYLCHDGSSAPTGSYHGILSSNVWGEWTLNDQLKINSSTHNGTGMGLLVGDDCYIGDCNVANAIGLRGTTSSNLATIYFGYDGNTGWAGGNRSPYLGTTGIYYTYTGSGYVSAGFNTNARINFTSGPGTNFIGPGFVDGVGQGQYNNLIIGSWYGISFVDTCTNNRNIAMNVRAGYVYAISHPTWSDRRMKNDLGELSEKEALAILKNLIPHNFTMKQDKDKEIHSGFFAQDLRDILISNNIGHRSYLTMTKTENSTITEEELSSRDLTLDESQLQYGIDYSKMTAILWKGWQSHDDKITILEEKIAILQKELKELKGE